MGMADIRNAFNEVVRPVFTATQSLHSYARDNGVEMQVLTFIGAGRDSVPFRYETDKLSPGTDLVFAAAQAARDFLEKQKVSS
jgi:hypothetical protein